MLNRLIVDKLMCNFKI